MKILLLTLISLLSLSANAQESLLSRGQLTNEEFDANSILSAAKFELSGGISSNQKNKDYSGSFELGYFIKPQVQVSANLSTSFDSSNNLKTGILGSTYFFAPTGNFAPFVKIELANGFSTLSDSGLAASAGAIYFLTPNLGLKLLGSVATPVSQWSLSGLTMKGFFTIFL